MSGVCLYRIVTGKAQLSALFRALRKVATTPGKHPIRPRRSPKNGEHQLGTICGTGQLRRGFGGFGANGYPTILLEYAQQKTIAMFQIVDRAGISAKSRCPMRKRSTVKRVRKCCGGDNVEIGVKAVGTTTASGPCVEINAHMPELKSTCIVCWFDKNAAESWIKDYHERIIQRMDDIISELCQHRRRLMEELAKHG